MKKKPKDTLSRRAMKLLCKLLGVILIVMLAGTLLFQHFLDRLPPLQTGIGQEKEPLSVIQLGSSQPESAYPPIGGNGSSILNILLIGQDHREGEEGARSDSIILCTFHKETKVLTMTSFLRDLYVEIPGYHPNRINAAYSQGGMALLGRTLTHNFGLHIDGIVEVDFAQFSGIVDTLGGVQLELRQDEADLINRETGSSFSAGIQTLNGTQALVYSRIRKLDTDGDFSRTDRQRKVISALLNSYRNIQFNDLFPLLNQILPMIRTDMNNGQVLMCALEILPHLSGMELVSQHIPAAGTYTDKTVDNMAVLSADMDAARLQLRNSLLGEQ